MADRLTEEQLSGIEATIGVGGGVVILDDQARAMITELRERREEETRLRAEVSKLKADLERTKRRVVKVRRCQKGCSYGPDGHCLQCGVAG